MVLISYTDVQNLGENITSKELENDKHSVIRSMLFKLTQLDQNFIGMVENSRVTQKQCILGVSSA